MAPPGTAWRAHELRLLRGYAQRVLAGGFRSERQAARAALKEMAGIRDRQPRTAGRGSARSLEAIRGKLWQMTGKIGRHPSPAGWSAREVAIIDRYIRAFQAGKFVSLTQTARRCRQDLERLRRQQTGPWAAPRRSLPAVRAKVTNRAKASGRRFPRGVWSNEEKRVLEEYARVVAQGRYPSVAEAARDCQRKLRRLHVEDPGRFAARNVSGVLPKLRRRALALGYDPGPGRWSEPEQRIRETYARALIRGKFRDGAEAARACHEHLARLRRRYPRASWLARPRSLNSIHDGILSRAHRLGRRAAATPWSRVERLLLDQCARRVLDGRCPSARRAAREFIVARDELRKRDPDSPWTLVRRAFRNVHNRMIIRARELGRPFLAVPWSLAENEIVNRYARDRLLGRFPSSDLAARACLREVAELHRRHPNARWSHVHRTRIAALDHLRRRMRAWGLVWHGSAWNPWEDEVLQTYAQALARRRFQTRGDAAQECWLELNRRHQFRWRRRFGSRAVPHYRAVSAVGTRLGTRAAALKRRRTRMTRPGTGALQR